jgi:hypothetical protein
MQDRVYQRKRKLVEKFIKKYGKIDHSIILNNVDVDYDTLLKILSDFLSCVTRAAQNNVNCEHM